MAYITCEDVTLGYEDGVVASNIRFQVNKGDYLYIVGENGAGKSTLMKTLLHLLKPLKGRLVMGDDCKAHEIGYLPQQTLVQRDFPATVYEIVLSGALPRCGRRPFFSRKEKEVAIETMKKLDVYDLKNECYRNLSGGQQQRVLLARALCATTKLLLLDEPVNGLDPKVTVRFYELVQELNKDGVTIIMVSHDIQAATKYASHILHMEKTGSFYGTKEEYLKSKEWQDFCRMGGGDD